ncbi:MAG: branched-chain amino acid aminotransferase [Clostridia bacterium]|nr:branched-chain amino acid aminotransferase [Clostridia bacterium]
MLNIRVERTTQPKAKPVDESKLGFGTIFTDHMFIMDYNPEKGWHDPRIIPYANFDITPAAAVFHYGMGIFEGLKAYRREDGKVQLFRPDENAKRMISSARRMCLPEVPEEDFLQAVKTLVSIDSEWTPNSPGTSLYVRPTLICDAGDLSMHTLESAKFFIILSPVGSYYKGDLTPVKIMIEEEEARSVKGGTGFAKCGGNYAASFHATVKAEKKGYSQVLWLDGATKQYIEEVGSNNIMFKIGDKIVTPSLEGTILAGITRKSCIDLFKKWGIEVEERKMPVSELLEDLEKGNVKEVFGVGTAAVITPVSVLGYGGKDYEFNNGKVGETTRRLFDEIVGIQWGRRPDEFNWTVEIE